MDCQRGCNKLRSEYIPDDAFAAILGRIQPDNARAMRVSRETGARIGDVLALRVGDLNGTMLKYTASKTGKQDVKEISPGLADELRAHAARNGLLFPGRRGDKPRTRQAVWADVKRGARRAGVPLEGVSPHTARKCYAVELYRTDGLEAAKNALQHDNMATTLLYTMADVTGQSKGSGLVSCCLSNPAFYGAFVRAIAEEVVKLLKEQQIQQ